MNLQPSQPLFNVIGYTHNTTLNTITIHLDENEHFATEVIIDGEDFEDYLNKFDQLYRECSEIIRGELRTVTDILSLEEFMDYSYYGACQNLYDYLKTLIKK
jgi:hypothetical protein